MKKHLLTVLLSFCLLGCQAPEYKEFSLNLFQHRDPIAIKTDEIVVLSNVIQYDRLPHIEDEMIISPEKALKEWAKNRFYPLKSTRSDKMQIIIEKAYMTKTDEKAENWYTLDNEAYKLTYDLKINFEKNGKVLYSQTVSGYESSSLPKKSSMSDKEQVFEKMMNKMIQKVNQRALYQMPKEFIVSN